MFGMVLSSMLLLAANSSPVQADYEYRIQRTDETIRIDGVLSESIWSKVPLATEFWMSYPVDDKRVGDALRTEVRLMSDDQFLYIGVICYGPQDYVIKTLKRDTEFEDGDGFGVVIDPVNEKTNGFAFGVNPAGVQTEYLVTGQAGRREDLAPGRLPKGINIAWDNKWLSEVTNHPDKWVAEIAIPFKTLRFDAGKKTWGINFFRLDAGTNSIHTWAPVPIEFKEIDLGLSVVVSGLHDEVEKCCRNAGLKRHTVNQSLGRWGRIDRLPSEEVLEINTMCGHGMVAVGLIEEIAGRVRAGELTAEEGAEELFKPCMCGIFNPVRAAGLLKAMSERQVGPVEC